MSEGFGEPIGAGRIAEIYAQDDLVLKLFRPGQPKANVFREAANLAVAESLGLPAPRIIEVRQHDGRWGLLMTRIEGQTLMAQVEADPAAAEPCLAELVRLQTRLHATTTPTLPALKPKLAAAIARAGGLNQTQKSRLAALLDGLPDGYALCHNDFHPLNIIGPPGEAGIVDWLDAASGDPAADACRTWLILQLYSPAHARAYLHAYATATGTGAEAIMAWLPVVAGARLAEEIAGESQALLALVAGEDAR